MPADRVRLFEGSAKHTSAVIDALVDGDGSLVVFGHDLGATPEDAERQRDEGYEIRVPDASRLLLELLKDRFGGDLALVADLREWLEERGIAYDDGT